MRRRSRINSSIYMLAIWAGLLLLPAPGLAQANLVISGTPTTVIKTGHTELIGSILVTVGAGTTAADNLQITIAPAALTNNIAGVLLTGSGALATATAVSLAPDSGTLVISIPAGATAGSTLNISGLRVSVPSMGTATTLDARLGLGANFITAGQTTVRVVSSVLDGLVVDPATDAAFTISNGLLVDTLGSFTFSEGASNAFSSAVGTLGQTNATQIVFQVTGLPDGVSVTLPATITAVGSGATFNTQSLSAQTVTNQFLPARVAYVFSDAVNGPLLTDTFTVTPTISLASSFGNGSVTVQASLGPIGTASTPNSTIPRFAEQLLPSNVTLQIPTRTLVFPISSADTEARIVVANVASGNAVLTARARQNDGMLLSGGGISNNVSVTLTGRQTTPLLLRQLFGSSVSPVSVGSIEVESQSTRLVGTAVERAAGGSFAMPVLDQATTLVLPLDRRTSADNPAITIHNAGSASAAVTVTLRTSTGLSVATASRSVLPSGAVREQLSSLFQLQTGALPLTGYVVLASNVPIRATLAINPDTRAEGIPGMTPFGQIRLFYPWFVFGGSYNTVVTLVNSSGSDRARLTLTALQASGATLGSPVAREMAPNERIDLDLSSLFGTSSSAVVTGYLRFDLDQQIPGNPFSGPPPVSGLVRISTPSFSTAAPLLVTSGSELFFTPTAESTTEYTGLSLLNATDVSADVTVEVIGANGTSLGSVTFALSPRTLRAQLLSELVPGSLGHVDGTLRVSSQSAPVMAATFRGSWSLQDLLYLHGQIAP